MGESGLDLGGLRRKFFTLFNTAASDVLLHGSKSRKFFYEQYKCNPGEQTPE